jgi:ADP-ribosylglycohydrolase
VGRNERRPGEEAAGGLPGVGASREGTMELSPEVRDRAAGVLLGQAVGDALGVPYQFATPPVQAGTAKTVGGGPWSLAPGEWSEATQMAIGVADALGDYGPSSDWGLGTDHSEVDLHPPLWAAAHNFLRWYVSDPAHVDNLTRQVLEPVLGPVLKDRAKVERRLLGEDRADSLLTDLAREAAAGPGAGSDGSAGQAWQTGSDGLDGSAGSAGADGPDGPAGNAGLARTAVVGVASLTDRVLTARLAAGMCALTHADPRYVEACILWSEAVRVAIVEERLDVRAGLDLLDPRQDGTLTQGWRGAEPPLRATGDRRAYWDQMIAEAESGPITKFNPNGCVVTALQAAWAAIHATAPLGADPARFERALQLAVSIGGDTVAVAATAGGLLGGFFGAAGIPADLARQVHGWPSNASQDRLIHVSLMAAGLEEGQLGMIERFG